MNIHKHNAAGGEATSGHNQPQASWSQWFKNQLFQVVPDEIAMCEFDCKSPNCREGGWAHCERRLRGQGYFSLIA
jgi:hypothetical protein